MANTLSTKKRSRQTGRRNDRNKLVKTRYKSLRKKLDIALESGDKKEAAEQFKAYSSAVDRAAKNNVIHKNAAARFKSAVSAKLA